eukprot:8922683-Lingulodinium_polyedra.AAC.1
MSLATTSFATYEAFVSQRVSLAAPNCNKHEGLIKRVGRDRNAHGQLYVYTVDYEHTTHVKHIEERRFSPLPRLGWRLRATATNKTMH